MGLQPMPNENMPAGREVQPHFPMAVLQRSDVVLMKAWMPLAGTAGTHKT